MVLGEKAMIKWENEGRKKVRLGFSCHYFPSFQLLQTGNARENCMTKREKKLWRRFRNSVKLRKKKPRKIDK